MFYKNSSVEKYLNDLSARLPAPGGGSAAAVSGALGCALLSMVCNFTVGKEKYKRFEKDVQKMLIKSEDLRKELLRLLDLDVAAYKSKDLNKSLDVPVRVGKACLEAMQLCPDLVKKGNRNLISDVSCAAILLEAGFSSAYVNVVINLKYLKNQRISDRMHKYFIPNLRKMQNIRKKAEKDVSKIIRG